MFVGVNPWDRVVCVPEREQVRRARLWRGLREAETFGELRAIVTRADYRTIVERCGVERPRRDDEFGPGMIEGYSDVDWPPGLDTAQAA